MDINFIIFFIFLIFILCIIDHITNGMTLIVFAFFMVAIFANTQSDTPIFFSNTAYLGWGQLFNMFWLILAILCIVKSYVLVKGKSELSILSHG